MSKESQAVPVFPVVAPVAGGDHLADVLERIANGMNPEGGAPTDGAGNGDAGSGEGATGATTTETPEQELERRRLEDRERQQREVAREAVIEAFKAVEVDRQQDADRIKQFALEAFKDVAGTGEMRSQIEEVVRGLRAPSRRASEGSSEEHLRELAAGGDPTQGNGTGVAVQDPSQLRVGANREAQALWESKRFLSFFKAVRDIKEGLASEGQRQFLLDMRQKAMAEGTDTAGGFLIHPEWMADILPLLRARAVVLQANPKIQPFAKQMNQTSVSTGASAAYTLENARIPTSEMTLAEAPLLTPKNLTALVPISVYLLNDASPEAEQMIREELATVMALRGDLAFLQGTGNSGEPKGFKNMVGTTQDPVTIPTNGVQLTLQTMRRIIAALDEQNTQVIRPVFFWHPKFVTYLQTLQEMSAGAPTGRLLVDSGILTVNDDRRSGTFEGIQWFATTQIPTNIAQGSNNSTYLILANMEEAIMGRNQDLEVAVSTEASYSTDGGATWHSAFQESQALFRAVERHDFAHRRPAQVIVQNGVLLS